MAFHSNCTLPSHVVSYVATNDVRSTLDILWSSLGTLVACTYTVLHLNVPEQRKGKSPSLWPSIKWSMVTLVAPELILVKATGDWSHARAQLRKLHQTRPETKASWTLTHMLFAEMGGFVLEYQSDTPTTESVEETEQNESPTTTDVDIEESSPENDEHTTGELPSAEDSRSTRSLTQAASRSSEVDIADDRSVEQAEELKCDQGELGHPDLDSSETNETPEVETFHLTAKALKCAIEQGLLSTEIVSVEEIWGRSRSTLFPKLLSMGQVLYFLVDCLVRLGRQFPLTPLEVGVIGFVCCSTITYLFSLQKPKDVTLCITLKRYESQLPEAITELFEPSGDDSVQVGRAVPNDHGITDRYLFTFFISSILLGAVHLAGWNLTYPSEVDAWLWRSAALTSTVVFALYSILAIIMSWVENSWITEEVIHIINVTTAVIVAVLYTASRLILIVEMFRCLFHLPPGAYVTTWTTSIPHIG